MESFNRSLEDVKIDAQDGFLMEVQDLVKQAKEEKSHFYGASILTKCISELRRLYAMERAIRRTM